MIPKIIHLCWFSDDPYPVEIKTCLKSWQRVLPDYEVKVWRMADARAIGMDYINEALDARRWAFAADVVRFYAVYTYGGIYMDSDIYLYKRFDAVLPDEGFATFSEKISPEQTEFGLQAACFMGSKGNSFCREMLDYYAARHYTLPDATQDNTISPFTMRTVADRYGYVCDDREQHLDGGIAVYPTRLLAPHNHYPLDYETIGRHCVYGSWRKRKFGRRLELRIKHLFNLINYHLLGH